MAGKNTDYTGIIDLEVLVNAKQLKELMAGLSHLDKSAKTTSKALAQAGNALRQKGLTSPKISQAMGKFVKNMDKSGVSINEAGKFIDSFSGNVMSSSQLVKKMGGNLKKVKTDLKSAYGPDSLATVKKVKDAMRAQGIPMFKINQGLQAMTKNWKSSGIQVKKGGALYDANTGKQIQMKNAMQNTAKHGMKPFRGEFLSLMFAGMQLSATFGGMIKTVLQMTGIFDAFRGILASILLPILMPLISKWLPKFLDWISDDAHKKFLGNLIIFAATLGTILMQGAQLGLLISGFGGLQGMWGLLTKGATGFGQTFATVFGRVVGIFAIVAGVFRAFSGFLQSDWWKVVSGILLAVAGGFALVMGGWIPAAVVGLIALFIKLGDTFGKVAAIIMGALWPVVLMFNTLLGLVKGVWGLISGDGLKGFKGIGDMSSYNSQIGSKWNGTALANGGIVSKPTLAMIGEAGPEAVVPLSGNSSSGIGNINYNPTININAGGGSSGIDIDNIVNMVNERLHDDVRRIGI